jgi:hypothetical protein
MVPMKSLSDAMVTQATMEGLRAALLVFKYGGGVNCMFYKKNSLQWRKT